MLFGFLIFLYGSEMTIVLCSFSKKLLVKDYNRLFKDSDGPGKNLGQIR